VPLAQTKNKLKRGKGRTRCAKNTMKTPEFKGQQNRIASERNQRLKTYLGALTELRDNEKSYPEMLQWLQQQGEECSMATLKEFFRHCRHLQKIENRWSEFTISKAQSDGLPEFLKKQSAARGGHRDRAASPLGLATGHERKGHRGIA
jgi:hypothetical protein